jgi:hypothetical protein
MENVNEPATKQDIAMLRTEMQHLHDELLERLDNRETNLLQAFYAFAKSNQERLTQTERDATAIKDRLATIEERLMDLERKVNFPNFPQHPSQ